MFDGAPSLHPAMRGSFDWIGPEYSIILFIVPHTNPDLRTTNFDV
jgi:hypothetical protein